MLLNYCVVCIGKILVKFFFFFFGKFMGQAETLKKKDKSKLILILSQYRLNKLVQKGFYYIEFPIWGILPMLTLKVNSELKQ